MNDQIPQLQGNGSNRSQRKGALDRKENNLTHAVNSLVSKDGDEEHPFLEIVRRVQSDAVRCPLRVDLMQLFVCQSARSVRTVRTGRAEPLDTEGAHVGGS